MMSLPDTAPRFVLFLLLIVLFPIALFLAWAFDIRPTDGEESASESAMKAFVPVAVSVALLGSISFGLLRDGADVAPEPSVLATGGDFDDGGSSARASLAVLAFADLSPEGDQEYFGDGIAEALLNVLASVDDLSLASRTSSFAFREADRNVVEIANILNVAYVLEGSVRKSGNRVVITAQLIDAATDRHLWSNTFEHELTTENLFAIQEDIANAIVAALSEELDLGLTGSIEVVPVTENLDAYDLYLQAQQLEAIASTETIHRQVELAELAVELDPDFAEAWAWLAQWLVWLPTWDHSLDASPYYERAIAAAERALELNPSNSTAFNALAQAHNAANEWELWDEAVRRAQAQIPDFSRDPGDVLGLGYLSLANELVSDSEREGGHLIQALYLEAIGESEAVIGQFEQAILTGYNGGAEWNMAFAYWDVGRTSVWTAVWAREFLANDPELLPLLPHMRDLLASAPSERDRAYRGRSAEWGAGYSRRSIQSDRQPLARYEADDTCAARTQCAPDCPLRRPAARDLHRDCVHALRGERECSDHVALPQAPAKPRRTRHSC